MNDFLNQDNKAMVKTMLKSLKANDKTVCSSKRIETICSSQRFLHYLAAKKLGFPVTISGKRKNDPNSSDRGNNNKDSSQNRKTRFLFNNKKSGGMDYGDPIEI